MYLLVFLLDGVVYFVDQLLLLADAADVLLLTLQLQQQGQLGSVFFHALYFKYYKLADASTELARPSSLPSSELFNISVLPVLPLDPQLQLTRAACALLASCLPVASSCEYINIIICWG